MNLMCARREFKNAHERFNHMTMVINSYTEKDIPLSSLTHIVERTGNPFAAMLNLISRIDGLMSKAWLFNKSLTDFKRYAYVYSKLSILMSVEYDDPMSIKNPSAATKNILSNQPFNKSDIVVPKNEINIENINNGINRGKNVYVTLKVDGNLFFDTNQSLRPITKSDLNSPTLISDRINKKLENNPNKLLPNANMASAHGEIGAMQQLVNVGKAKNANIIIDVKGKDVCGFCRGDIAAMAEKSGANSVLIHANRDKTGAPVTYYWKPGMKSVKEVKK